MVAAAVVDDELGDVDDGVGAGSVLVTAGGAVVTVVVGPGGAVVTAVVVTGGAVGAAPVVVGSPTVVEVPATLVVVVLVDGDDDVVLVGAEVVAVVVEAGGAVGADPPPRTSKTFCFPVPFPKANTARYRPAGRSMGDTQKSPPSSATTTWLNTCCPSGCVAMVSVPVSPGSKPVPPTENGEVTLG
ncbi:MAG TPA: hypothetical protein VF855_07675 [Acidimicrobiales bacterium]